VADVDARLHDLLAGDPPESVLALEESDRAALADLLAESRRKQSESLETAFAATLKHVPFPIRGIVKRVLLG